MAEKICNCNFRFPLSHLFLKKFKVAIFLISVGTMFHTFELNKLREFRSYWIVLPELLRNSVCHLRLDYICCQNLITVARPKMEIYVFIKVTSLRAKDVTTILGAVPPIPLSKRCVCCPSLVTIVLLEVNYIIMVHSFIARTRNMEVDGCPSKGNLFGQSALLMNATYIIFP